MQPENWTVIQQLLNSIMFYIIIITVSVLMICFIICYLRQRSSRKIPARSRCKVETINHSKLRRKPPLNTSLDNKSDTLPNDSSHGNDPSSYLSHATSSHSLINELRPGSTFSELKRRKSSSDTKLFGLMNNEDISDMTVPSRLDDQRNQFKHNHCSDYVYGRHVHIGENPPGDHRIRKGTQQHHSTASYIEQSKIINSTMIPSPEEWIIHVEDHDYNNTTITDLENFQCISKSEKELEEKVERLPPAPSMTNIIADMIQNLKYGNVHDESNYLNNNTTGTYLPEVKPSKTNEEIIAVLVGESGVGKSTFINALVNYLYFSSLDTAMNSEPLVVLPVSFILALGHDFEEKIIAFGDPNINENHNANGQSVTQQCRSYVFRIGDRTVRIIDTPGIGDTRGLEQDQRNIRHIATYINTLPHVNAICMLFKPDKSRLDIVTRLYYNELITFLGPKVTKNVIYCFTNTRATFYTAGNTGLLVRKMIKDLPVPYNDILFEKKNVFCFDSEAFRFLMLLQNHITFSDEEVKEYQNSWKKSSEEANRLLKLISHGNTPVKKQDWSSLGNGLILIDSYARPWTEWFHDICRAAVLHDFGNRRSVVKFVCKSLPCPMKICRHCNWEQINLERLVIIDRKEASCNCKVPELFMIDYEIHHSIKNSDIDIISQIQQFEPLTHQLIEIQQQLRVKHIDRTDYFLSALIDAVKEEEYICSQSKIPNFNEMVLAYLKKLVEQYEKLVKLPVNEISEDSLISLIYRFLETSRHVENVKSQIEALEETYFNMLQSSTVVVPTKNDRSECIV